MLKERAFKEREQYFIALQNGSACEVSREVYRCWYAGRRQEKYQVERDRRNGVMSFDELNAFEDEEGAYMGDVFPSNEESVEDQALNHIYAKEIHAAIKKLRIEEQKLILAIFFENISLREYARRVGVTHRSMQKMRDAAFKILQKELAPLM